MNTRVFLVFTVYDTKNQSKNSKKRNAIFSATASDQQHWAAIAVKAVCRAKAAKAIAAAAAAAAIQRWDCRFCCKRIGTITISAACGVKAAQAITTSTAAAIQRWDGRFC
jgi:hypothetical protein